MAAQDASSWWGLSTSLTDAGDAAVSAVSAGLGFGAAPAAKRAPAGRKAGKEAGAAPPARKKPGEKFGQGIWAKAPAREARARGPTGAAPLKLTASEAAAAREIERCYGDFFNFLPFRKGWKTPPFTAGAAAGPFRRAARIVAAARKRDLDDGGFTLTAVDGAARDFMHGVDARTPLDDAFRDSLVHATLQDANGYVNGATRDRVDAFIVRYAAAAALPDDACDAAAPKRTGAPAAAARSGAAAAAAGRRAEDAGGGDAATARARSRLRPAAPRPDRAPSPTPPGSPRAERARSTSSAASTYTI